MHVLGVWRGVWGGGGMRFTPTTVDIVRRMPFQIFERMWTVVCVPVGWGRSSATLWKKTPGSATLERFLGSGWTSLARIPTEWNLTTCTLT
jgi:hypothetical protein